MNSTDKKTIQVMVKTGFTFSADAHFRSFRSARACLTRLENLGYATKEGNEYKPAMAAKDFVTYGLDTRPPTVPHCPR